MNHTKFTCISMKAKIHPKYDAEKVLKCACGAKYTVGSTAEQDFEVDVCRSCHPAWTKQLESVLDRADMVAKYRDKMKKIEALQKDRADKKAPVSAKKVTATKKAAK